MIFKPANWQNDVKILEATKSFLMICLKCKLVVFLELHLTVWIDIKRVHILWCNNFTSRNRSKVTHKDLYAKVFITSLFLIVKIKWKSLHLLRIEYKEWGRWPWSFSVTQPLREKQFIFHRSQHKLPPLHLLHFSF